MGFRGRSVQERKRGGTERVIKYIGTTHLLTQRRRSSSPTTQNGFPLPSIQAHVSKIGSLDKVVSSSLVASRHSGGGHGREKEEGEE